PGWWAGAATLDADELRADDRRVFAWRVAPPARVTASSGAGPFVAAALVVLEQGQRVRRGGDMVIGDRLEGGAAVGVVVPPADPTLIGPLNRALAARGVRWRLGATGTPGPVAASGLREINGIQVTRRYRVEATGDGGRGTGGDSTVMATVNGEPWLVRDAGVLLVGSRLDTAWTALPAAPAFVPFVDALVNRLARGEAPVSEVEGAPGVEFRTRGADTVGAIVSGPDARESDLTPAPATLVRDQLGAEVLDAAALDAARFAGAGKSDASGPLLVLALLGADSSARDHGTCRGGANRGAGHAARQSAGTRRRANVGWGAACCAPTLRRRGPASRGDGVRPRGDRDRGGAVQRARWHPRRVRLRDGVAGAGRMVGGRHRVAPGLRSGFAAIRRGDRADHHPAGAHRGTRDGRRRSAACCAPTTPVATGPAPERQRRRTGTGIRAAAGGGSRLGGGDAPSRRGPTAGRGTTAARRVVRGPGRVARPACALPAPGAECPGR